MAQHHARHHARRRRRVPLGLAALLGLNMVGVLATAQGSVPAVAGISASSSASSSPTVAEAGHLSTPRAAPARSRPAAPGASTRRPARTAQRARPDTVAATAKPGPFRTQKGKTFALKPVVAEAVDPSTPGAPSAPPASSTPEAPGTTGFRVSTFNLLGHGHTAKGGDRQGWAGSAIRMGWALQLMNQALIDVAGFQEFQTEQYHTFRNLTDGAWGVYPGTGLGRAAVHNSIVWREDTWSLVNANTIGIPYFGGDIIQMPYVLLENRFSGARVWFTNYHNPADAHGNAQRWRNSAIARETALVNQLHADGTPVIMTGDLNDREEAFCPLTGNAPLQAANGGSTGGGCRPPDRMPVDWIFGTLDLEFTGFTADDTGLVRKTTDHPFVWVTATLG